MEQRIKDIDFGTLLNKKFFPSPNAWEDEVLYFMMLDRFSDKNEKGYLDNDGQLVNPGTTPLFQPEDRGNATRTDEDRKAWVEAGSKFVGGTLRGLESKIGYLKRLGVTAIWISPIFKQLVSQHTYHGYGIQNFLDVDPRFGTREDLISMVKTAHTHGIRVILDIILNHSGDVFAYRPESFRCEIKDDHDNVIGKEACWQIDGTTYEVEGFKDRDGNLTLPFGPVPASEFPDGAIWPLEFQEPATFSRRGVIRNFDFDPEFREGDFFTLKDIRLGQGPVDYYQESAALLNLCEVYKFWIALADIDGFRVDTVKHMDDGASRLFTSAIHEFTQSIGKENFYLIAEITGGRVNAFRTLEEVGMNAALGINDIPDKLEYLVKGFRNPDDYFKLFRNSLLVQKESHVWFRDKVVTSFDDHDQVRKGQNKARFCYDEGPGQHENFRMILNALAFNAMTMGIPCIYYGSEQAFDGHGRNDRFIRESMFGGDFGAFQTKGRHFFNEQSHTYQELAKILTIRKESIVIRRGRQFLRPISGDGINFGLPQMVGKEIRSVVPWSRIFNKQEVLMAINTDYFQAKTAWVTIDNGLHAEGDMLTCIYSTDANQIGSQLNIEARNGKAVLLTVPAAGFVIYQ
ncbi:glycosidase [Catalinimonas alkaloidigena]|uniref:alpha-amylase family glycosyl hydrolase n=1 Tax=Catalinimonas alkaloidigena TaxID=1075417 RepID=UPI00240534AB|nr:alpha-amylase family glycosyl hydrolase [Catalinimonas alkaloidigena]MDF9796513.1 glycosidase [Catalinimonas alkaloidigena]